MSALQQCQNICGVGVRLYLGHGVLNDAVLINQIGGSHNPHADLAVELFLLPDIVGLDGSQLRVGQKQEGQLMLCGKLLVGSDAVLADADDGDALLDKFFISLGKGARLTGAAGGVILGVKIDYNLASGKIGQGDRGSLGIGESEIGGFGSGLKHDSFPPLRKTKCWGLEC